MSSIIQFGSGKLFLNPNAGNLATNPSPVRGFTVQDIKFDMKGSIKDLRGENQFPDDTAVSDKTGTFEFSIGRKDYSLLQQVFLADTTATGGTAVQPDESHVCATSITVTPPSSGTFVTDLGVHFADGTQFVKLPSGTPAAGQYTQTGAAYTFASADVGKTIYISYSFSLTAGNTVQMNNQVQGYSPQFEAFVVDTYQPVSGIFSVVHIYSAKISEVSMTNKRDGYGMFDLKGQYYNSASGRVIDFYTNK